MKSKDYWKIRTQKDEQQAQKIAETYCSKQKEYYKQMIAAIDKEVEVLYGKLSKQEYISRSELWNFKHYQALRQVINQQCEGLAVEQISITEQALERVVDRVLGENWKQNEPTRILSQAQVKSYLNEAWSGESYSSRIYKNCNQLAVKLSEEIGNMVVLGKSPDAVKAAIMQECGVSYKVANRLIRTEASYTFNQANFQRYQDMGAKKVEVLVEDDACEDCKALEGKEFDFLEAPIIPLHPYCRCCYLPIV